MITCAIAGLTVFCILGCGSGHTSRAMGEAADAMNESGPSAKPDAAAAPKAKPLVVLDYEDIQKLIASHKGKVVVVDAWATYCPPCMRDFHHLVDLHKQYGTDKVACVSLSFDFGDDAKLDELKPRIQAFLDRQGATFDNIISSETWDELYKKFDFAAVPAVFVYGTDGKLIARVDHSGDDETPIYERVKALVKKLVKD
jgi:thiol-disulfide isomerase/thioredoxin